jgi:streptogramin lyase
MAPARRQPQPYPVFVDEADPIWLTDFDANALVATRFRHYTLEAAGLREGYSYRSNSS